jgi:hypothetical protein
MAVVVEIGGVEETTSDAEEGGSGADDGTSDGTNETGGGAEAKDSELDIPDTRLIGLRILPGISLSE